MNKTYRRSLSSAGNGHRQWCSDTAVPLPMPVTAVTLLLKGIFPWVHILSENQIRSDSVNEVFKNHRNSSEIVRKMRVVGRHCVEDWRWCLEILESRTKLLASAGPGAHSQHVKQWMRNLLKGANHFHIRKNCVKESLPPLNLLWLFKNKSSHCLLMVM